MALKNFSKLKFDFWLLEGKEWLVFSFRRPQGSDLRLEVFGLERAKGGDQGQTRAAVILFRLILNGISRYTNAVAMSQISIRQ